MSVQSPDFAPFPKLYRFHRDIIITEKIDGTNAQICLVEENPHDAHFTPAGDLWLAAGSRSRYLTPDYDNFGFARWAWENAQELAQLGPGRHFGEWWGKGIQRTYGLQERRWSLFNTSRWADPIEGSSLAPACCHVVPVLYSGIMSEDAIDLLLGDLRECGSRAAPGFPRPEGVVIYHVPSNACFKKTLNGDGHKG